MMWRLALALSAYGGAAADWNLDAALTSHDTQHRVVAGAPSLTRDPRVVASCDVRGNLGPCGVVVQASPGADWLRDRWQAASDMGGTAIKGAHWIALDMGRVVSAASVVIDWEAAYAADYVIEVRASADDAWRPLFDAAVDSKRRSTRERGTSPGVPGPKPVPLHVIDTVAVSAAVAFAELRLFIRRPARGWGVSVWQIDAYPPPKSHLRGGSVASPVALLTF